MLAHIILLCILHLHFVRWTSAVHDSPRFIPREIGILVETLAFEPTAEPTEEPIVVNTLPPTSSPSQRCSPQQVFNYLSSMEISNTPTTISSEQFALFLSSAQLTNNQLFGSSSKFISRNKLNAYVNSVSNKGKRFRALMSTAVSATLFFDNTMGCEEFRSFDFDASMAINHLMNIAVVSVRNSSATSILRFELNRHFGDQGNNWINLVEVVALQATAHTPTPQPSSSPRNAFHSNKRYTIGVLVFPDFATYISTILCISLLMVLLATMGVRYIVHRSHWFKERKRRALEKKRIQGDHVNFTDPDNDSDYFHDYGLEEKDVVFVNPHSSPPDHNNHGQSLQRMRTISLDVGSAHGSISRKSSVFKEINEPASNVVIELNAIE